MKKILWGGVIVGVLLAAIVVLAVRDNKFGLASTSFVPYATDLIGTKSGTTTVGVYFTDPTLGAQSATSSYIKKISETWELMTFTGQILAASSTGANLHISFFGSNDDYCDTASSTTIYDVVTKNQVNWFDIGLHLINLSSNQTFSNSTSTFIWDTSGLHKGVGKELTFDKMNFRCVKFDVSGVSTTIWAQIKGK